MGISKKKVGMEFPILWDNQVRNERDIKVVVEGEIGNLVGSVGDSLRR